MMDSDDDEEDAVKVPATQQPPQSSIIEDLGDPSDEDEE